MWVGKLGFRVGLLSDGKLKAVVLVCMCPDKFVMQECPNSSPTWESILSLADAAISTHDPLANRKIFLRKKNFNDLTNFSCIWVFKVLC